MEERKNSNVVGFRDGVPRATPGFPDELVIKDLEWLLQRARDGEITGISYVATSADGSTLSHMNGFANRSTVGALFGLLQRVSAALER